MCVCVLVLPLPSVPDVSAADLDAELAGLQEEWAAEAAPDYLGTLPSCLPVSAVCDLAPTSPQRTFLSCLRCPLPFPRLPPTTPSCSEEGLSSALECLSLPFPRVPLPCFSSRLPLARVLCCPPPVAAPQWAGRVNVTMLTQQGWQGGVLIDVYKRVG